MARTARATALFGLALFGSLVPVGAARAGFISVLLSAGPDGSVTPSSSGSFRFTNPSGSPQVAVSQLGGAASAQTGTAGGESFFTGDGLPVTLSLADGSAYLSSTNAPGGAKPSGGLASGSPVAGGTPPPDAALLNVSLLAPAANGGQVLSVGVTDGAGVSLGAGQVTVPGGGWWVLGLTPGTTTTPPPPVDPGAGSGAGSSGDGGSTGTTPPPTAATPEPATLVLAALGLPLAGAARWLRRVNRRGGLNTSPAA